MMTIEQARAFLKANPWIYEHFESEVLYQIHNGITAGSAKEIWNRMRWDLKRAGKKTPLSDKLQALLPRMFREKHPEQAHFFEFRASQYDGDDGPTTIDMFGFEDE